MMRLKPFEIKAVGMQGGGLLPTYFNCVLEKVIREWFASIPEDMAQVRLQERRQ